MPKATLLIVLAISCGLSAGLGGLGLLTPVKNITSNVLGDDGLPDLPPFMPKCSLTDVNLVQCLVDAANQVIPTLVKGDVRYNMPSFSPITFKEATLHGDGLTYVLEDLYTDDWKTMRVINYTFDLPNLKAGLVGIIDRGEVTAKNYTITDGKILGISAYGHGKYNVTCLGMRMNFYGGLRFYNRGLHKYLEYLDSKAEITSVDRCYFYFENLQSTENSDVNAYMDANWEKFFKQIKPATEQYIDMFVDTQVNAIITRVPFSKLFLS